MQVSMPPLHPKQDEIRLHPARFKVLACGRRFGKTMLASVLALACALGGGAVWWIGPTAREAGIGWRAMRTLAQQVPGSRVAAATKTITFPNGGWISVLSAESATLRGEGLDLVVIDEAAYLASLSSSWQEDLRPALSDRRGAALLISTPNGRGDFYELFNRGLSAEHTDWGSFRCTTYENPFIPKGEIDAAKAELPPWVFEQEYLAEFVTFAGKVYKSFDPAGDCVFHSRQAGNEEHWGGIDFGFRNPTVVSIGAINRDDVLDVVDGLYAREMTTDDLIPACLDYQRRYNVRMFFADPSEPGDILTMRRAGVRVMGCPRVTGERGTSSVRQGCIEVETRLVSGRLRVAAHLRDHVREMDMYRYGDATKRGGEDEQPLKVDDHAPDSIRYMVVGVKHLKRSIGRVVVV